MPLPSACGPAAAIERAARCTAERLEGRVFLSAVTVTTLQDVVDVDPASVTLARLSDRAFNPDGRVSLREAVSAARNTPGADTVDLPAGKYVLDHGELSVAAAGPGNGITVRGTATIGSAVLDAGARSRVISVSGPSPVTLDGLTLTNGGKVDRGAGLLNTGTLALKNCALTGNTAAGAAGAEGGDDSEGDGGRGGDALGGAVYNAGSLKLDDCTLSGNAAIAGNGGDFFPEWGHVAGDGGDARGGAIYTVGPLTATDMTIRDNRATAGPGGGGITSDGKGGAGGDAAGGGIYNAATAADAVVLTSCTISGNATAVGAGGSAYGISGPSGFAYGGGIYNAEDATIVVAGGTLSGNDADAETYWDFDGGGYPMGAYTDEAGDARGGGAYNAGTLTLTDATISSNFAGGGTGAATDYTGGTGGDGLGGGIFNAASGDLELLRSAVTDNRARGGTGGIGISDYYLGKVGSGSGGGIYNLSALAVDRCTVTGNLAGDQGGGAYNGGVGGSFTANDTTFATNSAAKGGGIANTGAMTLARSTISDNKATGDVGGPGGTFMAEGGRGDDAVGGGVHNTGAATLVNCTVAGNAATGGEGGDGVYDAEGGAGGDGIGGAIASAGGSLTLTASTVSANTARGGAGGAGGPGDEYSPAGKKGATGRGLAGGIDNAGTGVVVRLADTIIAANSASTANPDVRGKGFTSGPAGKGGANLIGDVADATGFAVADKLGGNGHAVINPKLGPLADNGGPTMTMGLLAGSPALGAGNAAFAIGPDGKPLTTDQRGAGFARVVGAAADIGAFEAQQATGRVSGVFFYDLDHDGARDAGEPPLVGWTAYYDQNDNGKPDAGEPAATSDADGAYAITGLAPGRYNRIREDRHDGWTRTKPPGVYPQGYYDITLAAGQAVSGKDFGNFNTAPTPPVARDDAATTDHDTPVAIDVLSNDTDDVGLDPSTLAVTAAPAHGTLAVDAATGRVTYAPAAGFSGDDAFTYVVGDVEGATSAAARVSVAVTPEVGPPPPPPAFAVALAGDLPAAVVGGTPVKAKQAVTVTNMTDAVVAGPVMIKLVASTDHVMGDDDPAVATTVKRMKLKPHASRTFNVRIASFPVVAIDGMYCVMAQVSGAAGTSVPAESATEVAVAAPFVDLTGAFAEPLPAALTPGKRATVRLVVQNLGNVRAQGRVTVALSAAVHGPPGSSPVALASVPVRINLKPGGGSKRYGLRFTVPADLPHGPAFLGAAIDSENVIPETVESNNTVYSPRQVPG